LYNLSSGASNIAVGKEALYNNTTADNNTASGYQSLYSNTTGSHNTALGEAAGDNITTGSSNIIIGSGIDAPSATASNQLNIGNWIKRYDDGKMWQTKSIGEYSEFNLTRGSSAASFNFRLSSNEVGNSSFGVMLRIIDSRYTSGLGYSVYIIQADLPGSGGDATYRQVNGVVTGATGYTITNTANSATTTEFTITLNNSYSDLFVEAQTFAYTSNATTQLTQI
jgi:hypothetical protein